MNRLLVSLAALALALGGLPAAALAQADPATVIRQYFEARNRPDPAAGAAYFAADGVYDGGTGLCRAAPCVGRAAIQQELERLVASRATITSLQVAGGTVTARLEIASRSPAFQAAGVERIVNTVVAQVRGGQIAFFGVRNDLSDPQTARFVAVQGASPERPLLLPRTGAAPAPTTMAALMGVPFLVGLALRRLRRVR